MSNEKVDQSTVTLLSICPNCGGKCQWGCHPLQAEELRAKVIGGFLVPPVCQGCSSRGWMKPMCVVIPHTERGRDGKLLQPSTTRGGDS